MAKTDTGKNLSVIESSASASTNVSVTAGQLIVEDGGRAFYDNSLGERSRVGGTWLSDAEKSFIFTKSTQDVTASSLLVSPTDSTYGWKFTGYDHIDLVHPSADGNIGFKYDSTGAGLVITNKSQNDASHAVDVTLVLKDATHKLSEKVNKVSGKSLIDSNVADHISYTGSTFKLGNNWSFGMADMTHTSSAGEAKDLEFAIDSGLTLTTAADSGDFDITLVKGSKTHKLTEKANTTDVALLQYYGTTNITISDSSYFTVNETGETITGLTDAGKTQTELVIPYKINGVKITALFSGIGSSSEEPVSILNGSSTIKKVVIPKSVTTLGRGAFYKCGRLIDINIPDSVTSIGEYAFASSSLASVRIPDSVTSIEGSVFLNCSALASVRIPDSVTSIGDGAFLNCSALTSVRIPDSVTSIGGSAFSGRDPATLTIYCEQGSYAETYANANGHSVAYTDIEDEVIHNISEKAEAKTYTVSVPTTSWTSTTSGSSTIYKKTITVTGITATDTPIVDVVLSDTVDTAKKELEAYGCISRITTAANSITIYCYESAPTTAFTIQLLNVTSRQ